MGAEKKRRKAAAAARLEAAHAAGSLGKGMTRTDEADKMQKLSAKSTDRGSGTSATSQPFAVSSNWKRLLERKPKIAPKTSAQKASSVPDGGAADNIVALDCEMVGVGPSGTRSALARLSLVDHEGRVLIDSFVRPNERITDYRTHITGISAVTLQGPKVLKEEVARKRAAELMDGKVVVGHAVQHDFQALLLSHPQALTRDTALFRQLRIPGSEKKTPSLARLSEFWLHQAIRPDGKHDSVEDARIALRLYRLKSRMWEKSLRKEAGTRIGGTAAAGRRHESKAAAAASSDAASHNDTAAGLRTSSKSGSEARRNGKKRKRQTGT